MVNRPVIVSGGSGLIGSAFKQLAGKNGFGCTNLVRYNTDSVQDAVRWDPRRGENAVSDPSSLEGCGYAVHLAGANLSSHRWTSEYKKTIVDSRLDSSRALIHVFSRLKSPPRVLVCASAVGIYGDRGDEVLTETSAPGTGFLPEVCEAWEAATQDAATLGMRVVHLRFGVVLAPNGGALKMMLPLFKAALGGRLGDGRQWTSWITLNDAARVILFALEQASLSGAYNTVAPNPVTNRDFTLALGKAVHRPAPWIVPAFALKLAIGQMAEDTVLASTRVLPARLLAAGFHFESPDLQPALAGMV